jgi:flavorubredoxin
LDRQELNYNAHVEIAPGIFWVGFWDEGAGLHCNPYLIVDGDEAVLIDSGSRTHFSTVMVKVMRTGTSPQQIKRLIYHHADPDLCGNIPHVEELIGPGELEIISHKESNLFINYYSVTSPMRCIEDMNYEFCFSSGRKLKFIRTPFAHTNGCFITYDTQSKVLFSSDIFGSYDHNWDLYSSITDICSDCVMFRECMNGQCQGEEKYCQMMGIINFHRRTMPCKVALNYALDRIEELDISLIAPQHGSILATPESQQAVITQLRRIESLGINYFLQGEGR